MSSKPKILSCIAAIVSFVFLFVLSPAKGADKTTWTKYNNAVPPNTSDTTNWGNGRIPFGTGGKGDDDNIYGQSVIKDDSFYKMWYSGSDGSSFRIYYATSPDGLTWTKYTNAVPPSTSDTTNWGKGRIPLGTSGGDTNKVIYPTVIKVGTSYKMWYAGSYAGNNRIYHVTSSNGLTWIKYTNAVPAASNTTGTYGRVPLGTSGGDTKHVSEPCVIKDGSTYKMWYAGHDATNFRIYHATSTDGLAWKKYTNAIPAASDTTSTDGRVPVGETGGDIKSAQTPCVIKDGYTYKMWYAGKDASSKWRIYHALLDALPEGLIFYSH